MTTEKIVRTEAEIAEKALLKKKKAKQRLLAKKGIQVSLEEIQIGTPGRPPLSEEEVARRAAAKRPQGRPVMSDAEKAAAREKREKEKADRAAAIAAGLPVEESSKRPVGRPKMTEEEKAANRAKRAAEKAAQA